MLKYMGKCLLVEKNKEKVLVVGDLHLGYEEHLNKAGIFISRKMFNEMINEFNAVFRQTGKIDKIILLGDIKHDFGEIMKQEWREVSELINYLETKTKEVVILKGNHDKILEVITEKKGIGICDFYIWNEFCFLHGDKDFLEIYDKKIKYWIIGHGHPAVKISDGIRTEKYKCFLVGKFNSKNIIIVPSFFSYFEGSDPRENKISFAWDFDFDEFEVKVVGEDLEVLNFGKLKKLK